jgi:hypothetical protein
MIGILIRIAARAMILIKEADKDRGEAPATSRTIGLSPRFRWPVVPA